MVTSSRDVGNRRSQAGNPAWKASGSQTSRSSTWMLYLVLRRHALHYQPTIAFELGTESSVRSSESFNEAMAANTVRALEELQS